MRLHMTPCALRTAPIILSTSATPTVAGRSDGRSPRRSALSLSEPLVLNYLTRVRNLAYDLRRYVDYLLRSFDILYWADPVSLRQPRSERASVPPARPASPTAAPSAGSAAPTTRSFATATPQRLLLSARPLLPASLPGRTGSPPAYRSRHPHVEPAWQLSPFHVLRSPPAPASVQAR